MRQSCSEKTWIIPQLSVGHSKTPKQGPAHPDCNAHAGPRTPRLYPSIPHCLTFAWPLYVCAWMCAPVFVPPLCGGRSRVVARDIHACVGHEQCHARPLVCPPHSLPSLPYPLTTSNPDSSPPTSPSLSGLFPSTPAQSAVPSPAAPRPPSVPAGGRRRHVCCAASCVLRPAWPRHSRSRARLCG